MSAPAVPEGSPELDPEAQNAPLEVAIAGRILGRAGLSVNVANHVSVVHGSRMYVNPWSNLARLRPEDVLVLDLDGRVFSGHGPINPTIVIHRVLHRLLPAAHAIVHTHAPSAVSLGVFRTAPAIYDQEACFLAGQIGVLEEDYGGVVLSEKQVTSLAEALTRTPILLMPNHGALTIGETLGRAVLRMLDLEHACRRHIEIAAMSRSLGIAPTEIDAAVASQVSGKGSERERLRWRDLESQIRESDPELFT